jgi:hypothetical protein
VRIRQVSTIRGQPGITVPVILGLNQAQVSCEAKVDTGASLCIFARSHGERLGFDVTGGLRQIIGTVTGSFVVYLHEVDFSVAGLEFSAFVGFAEDETFKRNVLGRRGFLEQVTLGMALSLSALLTRPRHCKSRRVKYLNNVFEQDRRAMRRRWRAMQCFRPFHTAERTLEGVEALHMMRKGQVKSLAGRDSIGQARFVGGLFGVAA